MIDYKTYNGFLNIHPEEARKLLRASNGIQITEALFEETIQPGSREKFDPLYSLKEYENRGKPSAYQVYINSVDETEAALKLVSSLAHWRKLCSLRWFMEGRPEIGFEGLSQWRQDMAARDALEAKKVILRLSDDGNLNAAKALDKLASDAFKRMVSVKKRTTSTDSEPRDDGLEFLDNYRNK